MLKGSLQISKGYCYIKNIKLILYSTAHAEPAKSAATPRPVILVLDGITRRIDESRRIDPRYLAYFRGINPPHTFAADRVQKYTPRSTCTFVYRRNLDLR